MTLQEKLNELEERSRKTTNMSPTPVCRFCIIPRDDVPQLVKALRECLHSINTACQYMKDSGYDECYEPCEPEFQMFKALGETIKKVNEIMEKE